MNGLPENGLRITPMRQSAVGPHALRRRTSAWILWLGIVALIAIVAPAASALDWADLYQVEITVQDQSRGEQQAAAAMGLLQVLTRVTGLKDVPRHDEVRTALAQPERFVTQSLYQQRAGRDLPMTARVQAAAEQGRTSALSIVLRFSEAEIRRLVVAAGLPLWTANRPRTIVWLVQDDGERRDLLDAFAPAPILEAMRQRARERALPLLFPDLTQHQFDAERSAVSVVTVWTHDWATLVEASAAYDADNVLVGRLSRTPTGGWVSDWRLLSAAVEDIMDEQLFMVEAPLIELAGRDAVDHVADDLFARFAVYPGDESVVRLEITGVLDLSSYGAVLQYLDELDFVDGVQVERVDRGRLQVALTTRADAGRLQEVLRFQGRLRPATPQTPAVQRLAPPRTWEREVVRLEWLG
jgi:uncharacterized protein